MKKFYSLWIVSLLFLLFNSKLFAQQADHTTITLASPSIVNFTELADYQRTHPLPKSPRFVEQGEDREGKHKFHSRTIDTNAKTFDVTLPENELRTVSPDPHISFDGTLDNGSIIPPDVGGTAGNNYLMEANNQELDIYTKSGLLVNGLFIDNFFSSTSGGSYFDPHVAFDANYNKFIVIIDGVYSNNHSAIFIAVSITDDPNGNWYVYSFDATNNANDFLDYPLLGFNRNWMVITGNDFLSNGNTTTKIYVLNREDLYSGAGSTVHTFTDGSVFTETPAITMDISQEIEYLVADWDGSNGGYGYMKIWKITGTPSSPLYSAVNTIGVNHPWNEFTVNAPQLGSTHDLEVSDTRVNSLFYIKGSLWFTHCVALPLSNPNHDGVDWWQVDPVGNDLLQFGRIEDTQGDIFYYYPSLSINKYGDALLGYSISSSGIYASAEYSYHASADTLNSMQDGNLFKSGLKSYYKTFGGTRNRWGDYSTTTTDPVDNSFWTFQEFANTPANNWGTVVANVGGTDCSGTPVAGTISAVYSSICSGEGTILSLTNYTNGYTGIQFQWQQSIDTTSGWTDAVGYGNTASRYETGALDDPTYFRCIVSCTASGISDTTEIYLVKLNGFVQVANDTICSPGTVQLIATSNGTTNWFETDTSSVAISTGDTLNATIAGDTTFFVSTNTLTHQSVGMPTNAGGGGYFATFSAGLVFSAIGNFTLDTVYVYPNSTGIIKVNLVDVVSGLVVDSFSVTITSSQVHVKTAIPVDLQVTGGAAYYLNASGSTVTSIYRNNSGVNYPYEIDGVVSILHAINYADGYYYFFYDWRITSGCDCNKFPVHVHIDSVIVNAFASADTICFGDPVTLTGTGAQTYFWQPDNVSGSSIISNPEESTNYTVIGTDQYGCSASADVNVEVINCATNVIEIVPSSSLVIYPNPTTGEFEVTLDGTKAGDYTFSILNSLGQIVFSQEEKNLPLHFTKSFDLTELPPSIYFLEVKTEDGSIVRKFVRQ